MRSRITCPNVAFGAKLTPAMRHCPVCRTPIREQADSGHSSRSPEARPGGFFSRLFGSTPTTALAWYERALVCEKKADHDGALEALNQAIKLDSGYADAYYVRGLVGTIKARFEQAIADFMAVKRLKPASIDSLAVDFARKPVKVLRAGARIMGLPHAEGRPGGRDLQRVFRAGFAPGRGFRHARRFLPRAGRGGRSGSRGSNLCR